MRYFFTQLKFIKVRDILSGFLFLLALPIALIYRMKRAHLWLVCERTSEARDNGYWFYKYLCESHPEIDAVYAIKSDSPDYSKVTALSGEVIEFGSLKHWIYYLTAEINISSQKEGKPNAALCHFLEIYGIWKNRRVYLKHGIVCNDLKWHYYKVTKMWLYVNSSQKELDYCRDAFGYPPENMVLTGLCRYDNLYNDISDKKTVFIMPTHREWLSRPVKAYEKIDNVREFAETDYFRSWTDFLTNETLNRCIEENDLDVVFFLHPAVQKYASHFSSLNTKVKLMRNEDVDLQYMLKKAGLLVTDYSSIHFDFAYMKKPLLYYQFDYEKFREAHYQEGYFSYADDGFGKVCRSVDALVEEFCSAVACNMKIDDTYLQRINEFFSFFDNNNCSRVFDAIQAKLQKENH